MPLTDTAIRNAKPGAGTKKLSDGAGLQLWVKPNGAKLWCLAYRDPSGKQKKLSFGAYPALTLAKAREKREDAKALLAAGSDPGQHAKQEKANKVQADARREANTFAKLAAELLDKKRREGKATNTIGKREWLYGLAGEAFGKRPIAEIRPADVLAALRVVEGKGLLETARRMRSAIGEVFRYAIATGRAEDDPTFALRGALAAPTVTHRAAILDPEAFGGLLRAIDDFDGQPTTVAALKLMALLFQRPGELRQAHWREFDLDRGIWTIPASRMKMRREHRVPLPRQAIEILRGLHLITGAGDLVFSGIMSVRKPLSENTINSALRRMGYRQDEMTSHGFRASAATLLSEVGRFAPEIIDAAQSRQEANTVRRAYARGEHWDERVKLHAWWADYCDGLRDRKASSLQERL